MSYLACAAESGEADVTAPEEVAELAWISHADIPVSVPYGLFEPVQAYLDAVLLD